MQRSQRYKIMFEDDPYTKDKMILYVTQLRQQTRVANMPKIMKKLPNNEWKSLIKLSNEQKYGEKYLQPNEESISNSKKIFTRI